MDYCGALPTPALALYAQTQHIPAIMVTGSHIPFDRNGIKFYRPDGEISKADELAITAATVTLTDTPPLALPKINSAAIQQYQQRYLDFFPPNLLKDLHLGLYEHSSVARDVLRSLLEQLGARVTGIGRTDTFVPIDTEAVSEDDRRRGEEWSRQYELDAIISTDGDADRPLLADEQGHWLRGDIVGLLTSQFLELQQLAVPVNCNTAIERCGVFPQVTRTRIGSPYVIATMQDYDAAKGAIAGFEANGGYLLGSAIHRSGRMLAPLPMRDAVLPLLAVLSASRAVGKPISALIASLPRRFTGSNRIQNFSTISSQQLLNSWKRDAGQLIQWLGPEYGQLLSADDMDGLRLFFANQEIVHVRASRNAPEIRCYCEAASVERAHQLTTRVLELIQRLNH